MLKLQLMAHYQIVPPCVACERQNRTLQSILASCVSQHKDDWDLWVDLAIYAYNTSVHESTGFSPYELVFGRVARTPIELDLGIPVKVPVLMNTHIPFARIYSALLK